jgi:collagen type V/XI/XXIV/XXVII alpha
MSTLFAIYNDSGDEQLVLSLGRNISFFYRTNSDDEDVPVSFDINISDKEWHRLGISVKGDAVTIILDCDRQITRELRRSRKNTISVTGFVIIGQQLLDSNNLYLVKNS